MRVNVELKATQDISGLKDIVEQWETQFPQCKCIGVSAYGSFCVVLEMPPATTVLLPQLIYARGTIEEEA